MLRFHVPTEGGGRVDGTGLLASSALYGWTAAWRLERAGCSLVPCFGRERKVSPRGGCGGWFAARRRSGRAMMSRGDNEIGARQGGVPLAASKTDAAWVNRATQSRSGCNAVRCRKKKGLGGGGRRTRQAAVPGVGGAEGGCFVRRRSAGRALKQAGRQRRLSAQRRWRSRAQVGFQGLVCRVAVWEAARRRAAKPARGRREYE